LNHDQTLALLSFDFVRLTIEERIKTVKSLPVKFSKSFDMKNLIAYGHRIIIIPLAIIFGLVTGACRSEEVVRSQAALNGSPTPSHPESAYYSFPNKSSDFEETISSYLEPHSIRFERLSTVDGLSNALVFNILQDQQGYMWFATLNGLNKYDGYKFTVFRKTSFAFVALMAMHEDRNGNLWVGSGSGLQLVHRGTGTATRYSFRGDVYCIFEDRDGALWFSDSTGLYVMDLTNKTIEYSYQHNPDDPMGTRSLSSNIVNAIYEQPNGDLWIGTYKGLDYLDRKSDTFSHYVHDPEDPQSIGEGSVSIIYEDHKGNLWIGTEGGGLNLLDRSIGVFTHYIQDEDNPHSLSNNIVLSIYEDSLGSLWIGTYGGLNQLLPADIPLAKEQAPGDLPFIHYRHNPIDPHSLSDDAVLSIYEDNAGVLWIGTTNGVSKYNRRVSQFTRLQVVPEFLTEDDGDRDKPAPLSLSDNKIYALVEDQNGILWVGNLLGLDKLDRNAGIRTTYLYDPKDPNSLSDIQGNVILVDHAGILWVGTDGGWLERYELENDAFDHFHRFGETRFGRACVEAMVEDSNGNLWIGTMGEGLFRLDPERTTLTQFVHDPEDPASLSEDYIRGLLIDEYGALWVATFVGIIILDNTQDLADAKFIHYRWDPDDSASLSTDVVWSFYEDPNLSDEFVWIGSWGAGLIRFDRATQTFTNYTEEDGLPDNSVGCILSDSEGYLWLSTFTALSRFDPRTETFRNFDERDGVSPGVLSPRSCVRSQSGEMLFGGINGIDIFSPEQIRDNQHVPPIVITAFSKFYQTIYTELPPDEELTLPYIDNFISFEFAALDYTIPEKNQYAYMLEGIDKEWIYAGSQRRVDYPNLSPGSYIFRVKGSNNDGIWNEEGTSVRVRIAPPLWGTWWFWVIAISLVARGLWTGYRRRVAAIEERSRELELQVEERTTELKREIEQRMQVEEALQVSEMEQAVAAERSRLARDLHDSVTQSLYSLTLLAEAGQRMARARDIDQIEGNQARLGEIAQQALQEMRLMLYELRPLELETLGLVEAIEQRIEAVERRAGLEARLITEGEMKLPAELEEELYRVAQEALNNALKHAMASRVSVTLQAQEGKICLAVKDNGHGFDPAQARNKGGLGLVSMQERAEKIGGQLIVRSTPGEGTEIKITATINRNDPSIKERIDSDTSEDSP
jgi:signal transduction histidine kinase/ligand-binding sensor domain-containing protein